MELALHRVNAPPKEEPPVAIVQQGKPKIALSQLIRSVSGILNEFL